MRVTLHVNGSPNVSSTKRFRVGDVPGQVGVERARKAREMALNYLGNILGIEAISERLEQVEGDAVIAFVYDATNRNGGEGGDGSYRCEP